MGKQSDYYKEFQKTSRKVHSLNYRGLLSRGGFRL